MTRRVLIAGCGYVGTALGLELARSGSEVWGLRRSASGMPAEIRPVEADLRDRGSLALPEGLTHVVYAASPDARDDASYADAYARGIENLLGVLTARETMPERLVFVSSTSVYERDDGGWVDERSPTEATHAGARRLLEGEAVARSAPFPAVVIRFAGIYGPSRTRLLEQVRAGEARLPRGHPRYTNRIHRDDCAGSIAHLLSLDAPDPLYLGVDDEPADLADVMRWLAAEMGVPEPPEAEEGAEPSGRRYRTSKRCSNARLIASGYRLRFPTYREGYRALLDTGR